MSLYQFVLALVLGLYVGFARLHQLRFIARDPILTGILRVPRLPPQSTLWRFLASLHLTWRSRSFPFSASCGNESGPRAHVKLETVTLDTDTTVHTLYGHQMGGRKSYNPKNKGKRSYQPILTFLAETREYLMGGLRGGDRATGRQIAAHLESAFRALPAGRGRKSWGGPIRLLCWEAVEAYEKAACQFVIVARKTRRLVERLQQAEWKPSPRSDADAECEFSTSRKAGRGPAVSWRCVTKRARGRRGRAIPVVRHQRLQLPRVCHQPGRADRGGGVVLQSARRSREPDQGGQQRRRAGGPSSRRFDITAITFSWPCWPTTSTAGLRCSTAKPRPAWRRCGTPPWRRRGCAFCSWRQDLAHAGRTGCQLQRSVSGKGPVGAADAAAAGMGPPGSSFAPVVEGCAELRGTVCIKFHALAATYWEHAACRPALPAGMGRRLRQGGKPQKRRLARLLS